MTIEEQLNSLTPEGYIELFVIDTTVIGGNTIFRFVPDEYDIAGTTITWQGNSYTQFPITASDFEWDGSGEAPPRPSLTVSNVNKFILASIISLGDVVGAEVTRYRTFKEFLDNGSNPNSSAHLSEDIYYVEQKKIHNKQIVQFVLTSAIDKSFIKLPRRQILKDDIEGNLYAPGVSNTRFRGR